MSDDTDDPTLTRRTVLRTSAATAGVAGLAGAASGSAAALGGLASGTSTASTQKRGGRAQVDGDVRLREPFQLSSTPTGVSRNASCMAAESAEQAYLEYDIEYCDSDDDESDATMYVIPDEAELAQDEVYSFRSVRPCRANDLQMVAFGPSNQEC